MPGSPGLQPAAPIWPWQTKDPSSPPSPRPTSLAPAPPPRPRRQVLGALSPGPGQTPRATGTVGRAERGGSGRSGHKAGRALQPGGPGPDRLPTTVAGTQLSRSAGPRLRGLPSPDPGSRRCRCLPCLSRSQRGLSASLPSWSPGSHAGRRPDSPLARLPVGPPLPPPPPLLDPHKGDRACALRSAPGPAPCSSHAVRRRPEPRPSPPPTQRGRRGHRVGFRALNRRSVTGAARWKTWVCLCCGAEASCAAYLSWTGAASIWVRSKEPFNCPTLMECRGHRQGRPPGRHKSAGPR